MVSINYGAGKLTSYVDSEGNIDSAVLSKAITESYIVSRFGNLADSYITDYVDSAYVRARLTTQQIIDIIEQEPALDIQGHTNLDSTTIVGPLSVTGSFSLVGPMTLDSTVIDGPFTVNNISDLDSTNVVGQLDVTGLSTLDNVTAVGDVDITGTLNVAGATTLDATTIDGELYANNITYLDETIIDGNLTSNAYTYLDSTTVDGNLVVNYNTNTNTLNVDRLTTLDSTTIDGPFIVNNTSNLDSTNIVGPLDVNGITTLDSVDVSQQLDVGGVTYLDSTFTDGMLTVRAGATIDSANITGGLNVDGTTNLDNTYLIGTLTYNDSAVDQGWVRNRQNFNYDALYNQPTNLNEFTNGPGYTTVSDITSADLETQTFSITSANVTVLSGNDDANNSLTFNVDQILVYLNGVKLVEGSGNDWYVSTQNNGIGTAITFTTALQNSDVVEVVKVSGSVYVSASYLLISELKTIVAASTSFSDFQTRIAAL